MIELLYRSCRYCASHYLGFPSYKLNGVGSLCTCLTSIPKNKSVVLYLVDAECACDQLPIITLP